MSSIDSIDFKIFAHQVYLQHAGERICQFEYKGQLFWLKQPERPRGIWRLLKSSTAFEKEIENLQRLNKAGAPVPQLVFYSPDYFVLKDVGKTVNQWIEDSNTPKEQVGIILSDCVKALINLHKLGLVHGRPALRDIAWKDGYVTFIDVENVSKRDDLIWNKVRDSLIFIHGLFRARDLTQQQAKQIANLYKQYCDPIIWQEILRIMHKFYWVYYLVRPFKTIAGMDLLALIYLFEYIKQQKKELS